MKKLIPAALLLSLSFTTYADQIDVIYGEDNRVDVMSSSNPKFVEYARATAAMVPIINMHTVKKTVSFRTMSLSERGVCEKERFSHQPTAAACSGFLVGPKTLVTAGHCINTLKDCRSHKWVFDYKVSSADQTKLDAQTSNVYGCKKIIRRAMNAETSDDYAVIELDKTVKNRKPLGYRKSGKPEVGTPLVVIGHPTGLPTKISDSAEIRSLQSKFFVANLDTFGGNSGSAVINVKTGLVEGVLVRGELDYIKDEALGCMVPNVCPNDGCRGEDVTYIRNTGI